MPNIMLTYRCNLHCSYCFANEFVNKCSTDITLEDFQTAVDFLTKEGPASVGLIGGEPTLHPYFETIMQSLINNPSIEAITVYSNGLLIEKYLDVLINPKVHILVNCNSPAVIGGKAFETIFHALQVLLSRDEMKLRLNVGINLYDINMDYQYMINLLKDLSLHRVRISVTVPDFSVCGDVDVLEYFRAKKQFLLQFFRDMDEILVLPYYDCNKPPYCIWTEEEKAWLEAYVNKYPVKESNLIGNHSQCFPVIDILPSLQAVRCFGMSDFIKANIQDFPSPLGLY